MQVGLQILCTFLYFSGLETKCVLIHSGIYTAPYKLAVLTRALKVGQSAERLPRFTVQLMKRSILEQSWAVTKPRHAGAAYKRRARTVALVWTRTSVMNPSCLQDDFSWQLLWLFWKLGTHDLIRLCSVWASPWQWSMEWMDQYAWFRMAASLSDSSDARFCQRFFRVP